MPKRYFVYIMASKKNGTLYIGSTSDLMERIKAAQKLGIKQVGFLGQDELASGEVKLKSIATP